jgi:cyclohexanone monooxygenase
MPAGDAELERLRRKYREERDRRLAADRTSSLDLRGLFGRYRQDLYSAFVPREPVTGEADVLVVGAGLGGLVSAARLREAGLRRIRLVEFAGDVGGVWYWNRYPGVRCDVESYIYLPLLEELGYIPREKYASGAEIRDHARAIAKHYDLYREALFHTTVTGMRWDDAAGCWRVQTDRGDDLRSQYVVLALGTLNEPRIPAIPGIERFAGPIFHSSRWDYAVTGGAEDGELTGLADQHVVLVGTAASAVQCVPALARWARWLYVVQRTPCTVMPRDNRPTEPGWSRELEPGWQLRRIENFSSILDGGGAEVDLVDDGWTQTFSDLLKGARMADLDERARARELALADAARMNEIRARIAATVTDADTAERLKPYYSYLCKRPCFHDEYLPAFNRRNVTLLDTGGRGMDEVREREIVIGGRSFPVDVLIFATGFQLGENSALAKLNFPIAGCGGQSLTSKWSGGIATLHGVTSNGFPNLFFHPTLNSQSTGSSNWTHMIYLTSAHIAYVVDQVRQRGHRVFEVTPEAETGWVNAVVAARVDNREFLKACTPGRVNNEGRPAERPLQNANYGPGLPGLIDVLDRWHHDGDLPGMATH